LIMFLTSGIHSNNIHMCVLCVCVRVMCVCVCVVCVCVCVCVCVHVEREEAILKVCNYHQKPTSLLLLVKCLVSQVRVCTPSSAPGLASACGQTFPQWPLVQPCTCWIPSHASRVLPSPFASRVKGLSPRSGTSLGVLLVGLYPEHVTCW